MLDGFVSICYICNPHMRYTEIITLRLSAKLYRQLKAAAKVAKRDLPDYVRVTLEEIVDNGNQEEK